MCRRFICLATFILVSCLILAGTADAELVGWWKLDETSGNIAYDSSGNGNDGRLQGDPQWVEGQVGGALEFDGNGDYVDCGNAASLDIYGADAQVTIALWVKTPNVGQVHGSLVTKGEWKDGYSLLIKGEPRKLWAVDSDTTLSADPLTNDQWYHVAVTTDGATGEVRFYINGQLSGVRTKNSSGIGQTGMPVNIAREQRGGGRWNFNGMIDDVRIYNRVQTQEEIQAIVRGEAYPFASSPTPADGDIHVDPWVTLSWSPGDFAVSHDVYLGENFDDVNEGTGDTFRGNQIDTYFFVGFPGFPYPGGLVSGTTYYWRIDEVNNANAASPWKGDVWSFIVPPKKAHSPEPADEATFVDPYGTLGWVAGWDAVAHYVYFGDDYDTVLNAAGGTAQAGATYNPGDLEFMKTYYWRVDEFDGASTYTGNVWSFMTGPAFTDPDLRGWWKFDEGRGSVAFDWSGYSNHGTLVGGLQWVAGNIESALQFDGTDDYIDLDDPAELQITGNITLAAWIKSEGVGGERNIIAKGYVFSPNGEIRLQLNGGNYNVGSLDADGQHEVSAGGADADINQWVHLAGTYDGSKWNIYRNGQLLNSAENGVGAVPVAVGWAIGSRGGDMIDQLFEGLIDDVRIYSRVLTQAEIAAIMAVSEASRPSPSNLAADVRHTATLRWRAGDLAASHEVYFGTDEDAVKNAVTTSPEYKGAMAIGSESYDPGKLAWATTYYWRIDEVNSLNPGSPWMGSVWSFTTGDFLVVDDFEDYDIGNNEIWWAWKDGLGYVAHNNEPGYPGNGTGSEVGDGSTGSYTEENIVNAGAQSMPYFYNNNKQGYACYSEAEKTLIDTRDWTEQGVAELSLWFRGYPASVGSFVEGPVGTFTMTASGADIWYQSDEFHYAYKVLTGPGSIVAKVVSVGDTDDWAKAGVMIRETLDADSKHAMMIVSQASGITFQRRSETSGDSAADDAVNITTPYWVKIERDLAGNFTAYSSANGSTWQMQGVSEPIQMGSNVYIGLAVTAHNTAATCEAVFTNVTTTGSVGTQWANQDVGIVSNDVEPLYVVIANSAGTPAVVIYDDPAATQIDTWTEWVIPLQVFADQGIDLTNVDRIAVGLGIRGNMTIPGGSGKMLFDDIRLYRPREAAEQ